MSRVPEEIDKLRELIRRLTGGRIELFQQGERKAQRGWLQGKFRSPLLTVLSEMASNTSQQSDQPGSEIVVEFKAPDRDTELLDHAWDLYQQGMMKKKIAEELECTPGNVTRLLKKAAMLHGVTLEDGRVRRSQLDEKQMETPQYKLIAEEAALMWQQGASYSAIARKFDCSDMTAGKAIRFNYESQGLPIPTTATKREERRQKARKLREQGLTDVAIAKELGVSSTTVRNLLKE